MHSKVELLVELLPEIRGPLIISFLPTTQQASHSSFPLHGTLSGITTFRVTLSSTRPFYQAFLCQIWAHPFLQLTARYHHRESRRTLFPRLTGPNAGKQGETECSGQNTPHLVARSPRAGMLIYRELGQSETHRPHGETSAILPPPHPGQYAPRSWRWRPRRSQGDGRFGNGCGMASRLSQHITRTSPSLYKQKPALYVSRR